MYRVVTMKLGIISDTHDHVEHIHKAKELFIDREVNYIVHLGDYCAGPSVRAFDGVKLLGILGNNDGDPLRIEHSFTTIGGDFCGEFCVLKEDDLQIACYHGTESEIVASLIEGSRYDVVLYGHTHEAVHETVGTTLVINPGSAHGFQDDATIAILDTTTRDVELITL